MKMLPFLRTTRDRSPDALPRWPWMTRTVALASLVLGADAAFGAVHWHPDLAGARAAAKDSRRPVLVVFTAAWSDASQQLLERTLADDGAAAVVAACYEPVHVDVDAHPDLTRRLGVDRVPCGRVLGPGDEVIASFDCPASASGFIAEAARAAQSGATSRQRPEDSAVGQSIAGVAATGRDVTGRAWTTTHSDIGALSLGRDDGTKPAAPGSAAVVASKVRNLSAFGTGEQSPPAIVATSVASDRYTDRYTDRYAQAASATFAPTSPAAATPAAASPWPTAAAGGALTAPYATQAVAPPTLTAANPPASPWIQPPAPTTQPQTTTATPGGSASPAWQQTTPPTAQAWTAPPQTAPQAAAQPATQPVLPNYATAQAAPQSFPQTAAPQIAASAAPAAPPAGPSTAPPAVPEKKPSNQFAGFMPTLPNPFSGLKRKPEPATSAKAATAASAPAAPAAAEPDAVGSLPLGLEGYCPVTLAERGAWAEGRAQWGARHRGRTYLFAGPEQQKAFLADPDRYAPALSGDDAVVAFETGKSAPGQRRYGVVCQSRIYLFSSPETRDAFAANPDRYTTRIAAIERPATSGTRY